MTDTEPNKHIAPNYEVQKAVERTRQWFGEYKRYLWGIEQGLLKNEGLEFNSIDGYMGYMNEQCVQNNPSSTEEYESVSLRDKFYIALSSLMQRHWQEFFSDNPSLDEPRQKLNEWAKQKFDYVRQFKPEERDQKLDDYEAINPYTPQAYTLNFLESNKEALLDWSKKNKLDSLLKNAAKYNFSSGFGIPVLEWGDPRKPEINDGFLVHVTGNNSIKGMNASGFVGKFNGSRSVSFSINRFAHDGDKAILVPYKVLQESNFPMFEVSEAVDAGQLREVITIPIPFEVCMLVDTSSIPDKKLTMNTPNSDKGTFYGEEYLKNLAASMNL